MSTTATAMADLLQQAEAIQAARRRDLEAQADHLAAAVGVSAAAALEYLQAQAERAALPAEPTLAEPVREYTDSEVRDQAVRLGVDPETYLKLHKAQRGA